MQVTRDSAFVIMFPFFMGLILVLTFLDSKWAIYYLLVYIPVSAIVIYLVYGRKRASKKRD